LSGFISKRDRLLTGSKIKIESSRSANKKKIGDWVRLIITLGRIKNLLKIGKALVQTLLISAATAILGCDAPCRKFEKRFIILLSLLQSTT
jgi:hypothetical protein